MNTPDVTVQPCDPRNGRHLQLVVDASHDNTIVDNTYLPAHLDNHSAHNYLADQHLCWVICADNTPVGLINIHPYANTENAQGLETGLHETETWLHHDHRGQQLATIAWQHLHQPLIDAGCRELVAVVWEDNHPARRRLEHDQWAPHSVQLWQDQTSSGMCAYYTKTLTTDAGAAAPPTPAGTLNP